MDLNDQLLDAVINGDVQNINWLLRSGADVNHVDRGLTPLWVAVEYNKPLAVLALTAAGAIVDHTDNKFRQTVLFHAAADRNTEIIDALARAGADVNHADHVGETALFTAASEGKVEHILALVRAGADINHANSDGKTALFEAVRNGKVENISALLRAGADINHADKEGDTALDTAVFTANFQAVDVLVINGANVNYPDEVGMTVLWKAAYMDNERMVGALVRAGADVNHTDNQGRTALFPVARDGMVRGLLALLEAGADINHADMDGVTALIIAVQNGRLEVVVALLQAGAYVNVPNRAGKTALTMAMEIGNSEVLKALKTHLNKRLLDAAKAGDVQRINALVRAGAEVNTQCGGRTALSYAAEKGNVEAINALLMAGADVNQKEGLSRYVSAMRALTRPDRPTALSYAVENENVDAINALLRAGANVDDADRKGRTALIYAVQKKSVDVVKALLTAGVNVDHADNDGTTALIYAAKNGKLEFVKALLTAGADINITDLYGRTALSFARENSEVQRLLQKPSINHPVFPTEAFQCNGMSISLKKYLIDIVTRYTRLGVRNPYNISLDTFSDDGKMGMFFRYGPSTVVSVYFDNFGRLTVHHLEAKAPICTGDGRVIYSKEMPKGLLVYENNIDLQGPEHELCHSLSSPYEKNWGCFNRTSQGDYLIVYSVIPLKIYQVTNHTNCKPLPPVVEKEWVQIPRDVGFKVKDKYPNLDAIERLFRDQRDSRGTGLFRGGTRGIDFGGEFLFVGHVTLYKGGRECFPNWFTAKNTPRSSSSRMYFMYFFTIGRTNGMYKISRMSSCFQPPSSGTFHRIIFPCGIAHHKENVVVSFGRDDRDCLVTCYPKAEVDTMLAPVTYWSESNYVFHPNYAASLHRARVHTSPERSMLQRIKKSNRLGLIGTSPESEGRFNPSITNLNGTSGTKYVTAWRKLTGSIENWKGYNEVALESCSIKLDGGKLVYKRESEIVEFQAGTTTAGGEDPRLIMENNCPLMLINDVHPTRTVTINGRREYMRRMYIHNLNTDDSALTIHPFCHNISPADEAKEKNWGPFYVDGKLHFVYKVDPLVVGKVGVDFQCPSSTPMNIECEQDSQVPTAANLSKIFEANGLQMRGGTPGIRYSENEYLFVGHSVQQSSPCFADYMVQRFVEKNKGAFQIKYKNLYMAFFYTITKERDEWKMKRLSCCSHFPGKRENLTKIHFPSGLASANLGEDFEQSFIVSFGESDQHGGFCAVNRKFVEFILRPTEEWNVHNYVVDVNYFQNVARIDPEI